MDIIFGFTWLIDITIWYLGFNDGKGHTSIPSITQNENVIDFLCKNFNCSIDELKIYFTISEMRKRMLSLLRKHQLILPHAQNLRIRCDDFSWQNANSLPAFNGHLGITVRQYYFSKHRRTLRYPYLPCLIQYGGGSHRSFYPLEVLTVSINNLTASE